MKEHQIRTGKFTTTYLEGGEGTPLVLLHGPGEPSVWWMRVIPGLVKDFKVIVPDLPGHGRSGSPGKKFTREIFIAWLHDFIQYTCNTPPVLIGHVVGGSLAAHYAIQHGNIVRQLILVDSLGLAPFRPAPRFAFEFLRFMVRSSKKNQLRLMDQCMYDVDKLDTVMGEKWQDFLDYNLASANDPEKKSAAKKIMGILSGKIPEYQLKQLAVPVSLIWGRHDKANSVKIAKKASEKYGWPLHIIEDSRDDPKLEQPEAFVEAVQAELRKIPTQEAN
ncbi:alpha/beta fold hydrolase [Cerina litoralis]|uniref:alpha/beta fold hydrolase n=1 Tax=Cerina litoralis TaxID=2874477 RepID=UPI00295AA216|nr:alpha/beta hydrolase [Cerina litoralis]